MRTPQQRRNLIKLRDEVVKFIPDGKLRMRVFFNKCGTPACVLGYALASGKFEDSFKFTRFVKGEKETFGVESDEEWCHLFESDLPSDPSWIAANITDLIESET